MKQNPRIYNVLESLLLCFSLKILHEKISLAEPTEHSHVLYTQAGRQQCFLIHRNGTQALLWAKSHKIRNSPNRKVV